MSSSARRASTANSAAEYGCQGSRRSIRWCGTLRLLVRRRLGRADVQAAIDQRGIDADDLAAQALRPFQRERGLARRGRAHQGDGERALIGGHGEVSTGPGPVAEAKPRTVTLGVSTTAVENRWGKAVDKTLRTSPGKRLRVFRGFLASTPRAVHIACGQACGQSVMKASRACNDGTRREFGDFLTSVSP